MRQSTPFFEAFGPLLFGKAPRSSLRKLLDSLAGPAALSQLQQAFGYLIPQSLLSRSAKGTNSRERLFSPRLTFWAFLAQVLSPGSSCRDAVRRLLAWWAYQFPKEPLPSTDPSAYCQARGRLEDKSLQRIGAHLAERLERNTPAAELWKGRVVKIADGTTLSMPDTPANQKAWPQSATQKKGCGFPLLKLVGIFSLASGALLRLAQGSKHLHESQLLRQLWDCFCPGDILLADRGFCSYLHIAQLLARGVDVVLRLHQARPADFRAGRPLGKNDRLIQWRKPAQRTRAWTKEEFDALPQSLALRRVRYHVAAPGFRTREVILITSLLDPVAYPLTALAELYFQRWNIERHFREIKTLLGLDVRRCRSPKMIGKEVAMHLIAYHLVRALMQEAAIRSHVPLGRLSFKGSLDSLHHFADAIQAAAGKPRKQSALLDTLLRTIAADPLPHRPGRVEPRARKRRPKNYHLLTKPRRQMRVPAHRNRPRP
jgi:hypothetical protein